ncbi:MAG: 23S rRNA (uracil(1939)-C(5))-methyltransferase RlmD [Clostridia bacterium]|nr:23S rRNA (uracil(1939)-C(5))-methyltransferase RlmD [Clostridia bacterium]
MKPKEKIKLHIISTAQDGRGVARHDGLVVFVSGTLEGETVLAEIYTVHKTYATAGTIKVLEKSPYRAEPFCPVQEMCGGCPMAHIIYEKQLEIKKQTVSDALTRLGKFEPESFRLADTCGMETPFRYRNKMVFPVGEEREKVAGGFYAPRSHRLIALSDCAAGEKAASAALGCVTAFMNREKIAPYDEKTGKGSIRRVFVRTGYHSRELMIVISSATERIPKIDALADDLLAQDYGEYQLKSIILNINRKPNNLVLGDKNVTVWGSDTIKDTLMGLSFTISPHSFFQVNPMQTEVLYRKALELAGINQDTTVLDIYCGIGTISLCAAKQAKHVIGVEIVEKAISDAKENAKKNGMENAEFFCGAAEDVVPKLIEEKIKPDVVIIDPPRKGSDEKTLAAILTAKPERIVYVSCNPATLARDARVLADGGYRLECATPVDMFPNTEHVECVAKFTV